MPDYEEIRERFRERGQEHVFVGWDALPPSRRAELLDDCSRIDFAWIEERWREYTADQAGRVDKNVLEPALVERIPRNDEQARLHREAREIGEEKLRRGKVAACVAAGGQGSRLGHHSLKGSYPIGPVGSRSLFQWQAEQILARSRRYGSVIPWYIMTSQENDDATQAFFRENRHFGLAPDDVVFFPQEMVPCLDLSGKLMLASPSRLVMNPDGHGGILSGLVRSGACRDMLKRGVEIISYFQVDNPLTIIADPVFVGRHVKAEAEISSKVVEKNSPGEKVGLACLRDGKPAVVEYINLDPETLAARDADGRLVHWAGSIAIHMLNLNFIERVGGIGSLPWRWNRKKVQFHANGGPCRPERENAVKFETFIFDAIPLAAKTLNLETVREQEFAPVKNATGADSVDSCRRLLSNKFNRWLAGCGIASPAPGPFAGMGAGEPPLVEISPLYSLDAEELAGKIKPGGFKLERALLLD